MLRYLAFGFAMALLAHGLTHWHPHGPALVSGALLASAVIAAEDAGFDYVRRRARDIAGARGLDRDLRERVEAALLAEARTQTRPVISPVAAEALRLSKAAPAARPAASRSTGATAGQNHHARLDPQRQASAQRG